MIHHINNEDGDLFVESDTTPVGAVPGRVLSGREIELLMHFKSRRGWHPHSIIGEVKRFGFRLERKGHFQEVFRETDIDTYHRLVDSAMRYIGRRGVSGHGELRI